MFVLISILQRFQGSISSHQILWSTFAKYETVWNGRYEKGVIDAGKRDQSWDADSRKLAAKNSLIAK